MDDRDKVIKEFEKAVRKASSEGWDFVDLLTEDGFAILDLLKEQEPIKPYYNAKTNWYECGACHYSMTSGMHCRSELIPAYKVGFCAKCGRSVKWQ